MKILFLDFDGVLNSQQSMTWRHRTQPEAVDDFCPIACSNLLYILEKCPEVNIVVTSTWRLGETLEYLKDLLQVYGIPRSRILSVTPNLDVLNRGSEIEMWIKNTDHKVSQFVIVDDENDMEPYIDNLVQTDSKVGLDWNKTLEIIRRFQDGISTQK